MARLTFVLDDFAVALISNYTPPSSTISFNYNNTNQTLVKTIDYKEPELNIPGSDASQKMKATENDNRNNHTLTTKLNAIPTNIENTENETDNNKNNFRFLRVVALLSITDFAFSIDSITTAVAISDQYILIIFGAVIGVLALRFTSGIFLKLLDIFSRLETAGYVAILIVGIKLLLNTLIKESILPDYYFYFLILFAFIWGFSKKESKT